MMIFAVFRASMAYTTLSKMVTVFHINNTVKYVSEKSKVWQYSTGILYIFAPWNISNIALPLIGVRVNIFRGGEPSLPKKIF